MYGKIKSDRAWSIFSEAIRIQRKFTCEYCGKIFPDKKGLQCHHFYSRRRTNVKYDLENIVCLCAYHHRYFHENPVDAVEWMKEKLGQDGFDALRVRSNVYKKKDSAMELIEAKEFLKEVESEII